MGGQITTLLIALFGGAVAALIAGYFARPKTKGEAAQANANANVALSADAREWAQLWMKKAVDADDRAKAADDKAQDAEDRLDGAEDRLTDLDNKMAAAVVYMKMLRDEINKHDGHIPEPPPILREMIVP